MLKNLGKFGILTLDITIYYDNNCIAKVKSMQINGVTIWQMLEHMLYF